ncbi:hypothetical protein Rhopal_007046-T1 [Rhodotorula paludigena]|uniref:Amine oxidase n=1 Tax=Rhodotorula paludigena TaxID=86838 RepID=A0AAV5GZR6_9BASI|nr:hypothetical protein Rhopal_007046-T1 [Rhodotorula paludigena]
MRASVVAALGAALATTAFASPVAKQPYMKDRFKKQPAPKSWNTDVSGSQYHSSLNLTDIPDTPTVKAPHKNIWATLSTDEAAGVVAFLHNQTELNLTAAADAGSWDNLITVIDLLVPNKTESLAYMAGTGPEPERYAYASIMHNSLEEPYLEDYMVGPLPVSDKTTYSPYGFRTTTGSSRIRNYDADSDRTSPWMEEVASECDDIITELLGAPTANFSLWGIDPLWREDGRIINWVGFWGIPDSVFDGGTLLPQGLYMKFDITTRDPSEWKFLGWLHNYVFYPTTEAFRDAWDKGLIEKTPRNAGMDQPWIGTDRKGEELPFDNLPPPRQIAPGGHRFAVDDDEQYVEWMDFSFYYSFRRDSGIRLWDIKYKGEKIVHELGLNEALAHYAGNDPVQSGFGPYAFELVSGFDCPTYAKYANVTYHSHEISTIHRRSVCFYEHDVGYPMQRHTNGQYTAVTKNIAFSMKSVSTIGNYDYNIQSAYVAKNGEYGYQIHDGLSGSMHDHVLNWKMDVDILGTANTVGFHTVEPKTVKYDWSPVERNTMHVVRSELTNEANSTLHWGENGKTMVLIYNKEEKNKYGEDRAWRLMPHIGGAGMYSTIQNSSNSGPAMNFAKAPLYVTQHHDSEFVSAHPQSSYDPFNPLIDFAEYLNDENLEQEDLVLWFNLGMHHVPHTGDLANTVHQTAHAGMIFSPHNYLYNQPSQQSSQMVRINYNTSTGDSFVTEMLQFGSVPATGLYNLTADNPNYWEYEGSANIRKLPYDPLNPYDETGPR